MYVISSGACDLPNSASPVTPAQIAQQDAYVAKVGRRFTNGNRDFAQIISALTPPQPGGSCDDFTSSVSLDNISPFPFPVPPGVVYAGGGVKLGTPSAPAVPGSPANAPAGSVWTAPGGGSTYPWGPVQRDVSSLIPAWACAPSTIAGAGGGAGAAPSNKFLWGALAVVAGLALVTGDRSGRRR
jgi:hypothetical protein